MHAWVSASMHAWVFWWDTASPIFFSFKAKRSIPPLFFPSLSPYQERTLYYHQYLLCSARRERNRSWAINPGLTQRRIYFCPGWDTAGHREAHLFLVRLLQKWCIATSLRESVLPAPSHRIGTTCSFAPRATDTKETHLSAPPLLIHWYIYTEGLLQTESC